MIQEKIKQIHKEFKTALDSSSLKVSELNDDLNDIQEAKNRLSSLGLVNSETYRKFTDKLNQQNVVTKANALAKEIKVLEATFPQYRLIGLKKLLEICKKYNLCVSEITNFVGIVPNKNLSEIETHKKEIISVGGRKCSNAKIEDMISGYYYTSNEPNYFMAAPQKDFKEGLTNIEGVLYSIEKPFFEFKTKITLATPDPIVLCPMNIQGAIIFQIVTAWGVEADDDYVTNKVKVEVNNN